MGISVCYLCTELGGELVKNFFCFCFFWLVNTNSTVHQMQAIKESLLWMAAANTEVSDMCISSLQGTPVTTVGQMKNVEMALVASRDPGENCSKTLDVH